MYSSMHVATINKESLNLKVRKKKIFKEKKRKGEIDEIIL